MAGRIKLPVAVQRAEQRLDAARVAHRMAQAGDDAGAKAKAHNSLLQAGRSLHQAKLAAEGRRP